MGDAEALEAFARLGGEHGCAVVGEQGARQSALVEGLREAVDEGLGGLVEIPLQVAAEPGAVVEDAEQLGFLPLAAGGEHGARALVEVEVPEAMDVGDLVGAGLASRERLVALALGVAPIAGPDEALPAHEAAHGGVAGYQAEGGVLAREGDEVVVVQLPGPSRMIAVLAGDGLGERGTDATVSIGAATLSEITPAEDAMVALLELADRRMYLAKTSGRNRVCVTWEGRGAAVVIPIAPLGVAHGARCDRARRGAGSQERGPRDPTCRSEDLLRPASTRRSGRPAQANLSGAPWRHGMIGSWGEAWARWWCARSGSVRRWFMPGPLGDRSSRSPFRSWFYVLRGGQWARPLPIGLLHGRLRAPHGQGCDPRRRQRRDVDHAAAGDERPGAGRRGGGVEDDADAPPATLKSTRRPLDGPGRRSMRLDHDRRELRRLKSRMQHGHRPALMQWDHAHSFAHSAAQVDSNALTAPNTDGCGRAGTA